MTRIGCHRPCDSERSPSSFESRKSHQVRMRRKTRHRALFTGHFLVNFRHCVRTRPVYGVESREERCIKPPFCGPKPSKVIALSLISTTWSTCGSSCFPNCFKLDRLVPSVAHTKSSSLLFLSSTEQQKGKLCRTSAGMTSKICWLHVCNEDR